MEFLRWSNEPRLRRPILVAAFAGWNDAGEAATSAVRFLIERWRAQPFADIDPEHFYDFTTQRPLVELDADANRRIVWPTNELAAAPVPGLNSDVILLEGTEPALMWRTFTEQVIGLVRRFDVQLVLTCGALISDVPHSRPVPIYGTSYDDASMERLGVEASTYEGPTGIVGVLHAACRDAGVPSASLWAAVPSYVHDAPSPKATLALVEKISELLQVNIATTELEISSAAYERQINKLVANDDDTAEIVQQLEERYDELDDSGSLVEEVERFLRDRADE